MTWLRWRSGRGSNPKGGHFGRVSAQRIKRIEADSGRFEPRNAEKVYKQGRHAIVVALLATTAHANDYEVTLKRVSDIDNGPGLPHVCVYDFFGRPYTIESSSCPVQIVVDTKTGDWR